MSISLIIGLCVSGIILIACETIIPGGVVGTIGGILALIGVIGSFSYGITTGLLVLITVLFLSTVSILLLLQKLPDSAHGKHLCLGENQKNFKASGEEKIAEIGQAGTAVTMLRPAGVAEIDDLRIDVVTQGDFIEAGKPIKVIDVKGSRVVVEENC